MAIPWATIGNAAQAIGSVKSLFSGGNENSGLINAANQQALKIGLDSFYRGTQVRVADAKKAGLHPLSVLGSNIQATQPQIMSSGYSGDDPGTALQNMGQSLRNMAGMSAADRAIHEANLKAIEASTNRDNSQAAYYASLAARESQSGNATAPQPAGPPAAGLVQGQPDVVTSAKKDQPHVTAGTHSAFKDINVIDGKGRVKVIAVPNQDVLQELEALGYALTAHENVRRWGQSLKGSFKNTGRHIRQRLFGNPTLR